MRVTTVDGLNKYPTNFWRTMPLPLRKFMGSSSSSRLLKDICTHHTFIRDPPDIVLSLYKQIFQQYKMDIFEKCEDPNNLDPFGDPVQFPTNPYYPPGKKI